MRSLLDIPSFFLFLNSNSPSPSSEELNTGLKKTSLNVSFVDDGDNDI